MKKILAMLLAAVMLGLSVSAVVAENGDTLPTLANTSQLTVTEDGYVTGIGTNVTAEELVRNFNNRSAIKITAPDVLSSARESIAYRLMDELEK